MARRRQAARADRQKPAQSFEIGPIGRWRTISAFVRELAASSPDADPELFERFVLGLTDPVRRLDELAVLGERSVAGDWHARCELRRKVGEIVATVPTVRGAVERLATVSGADCGCDGLVAEQSGQGASVVDEEALASLAFAVAASFGSDSPEARAEAIDALAALSVAAGMLDGLVAASEHEGRAALIGRLEDLAELGRLYWVAPTAMSVRSLSPPAPPADALGGGGPAGLPGLPGGGLPPGGLPPGGLPHGGVPHGPHDPDDPGGLPHIIDDLLAQLRKRRHWDPEKWDHPYPWWKDEIEYIDWQMIERIRCLLALLRLLKERADALPPTRPSPVTWSDGITGITQTGACAGDSITINGKGFGNSQPPGVVVLVPTQHGCRPATVSSWSNRRITLTLPADVSSGQVGFGDAAYIAAYDVWATHQNDLAQAISSLWCAHQAFPIVPLFGECPPATPVNHLRAGVPVIASFTANWASSAAIEPGDPIMLRWTVTNAEHVRIDRTSASGPTFGGSSSLIDPAVASFGLTPPGNAAVATFTYRLTATGPCGTQTADVTIVSAKRPRLRIASVEVTQSIQTPTASVRLAERKPTVVRVTINHGLAGWGANAVPGVTGRIRVHRGAVTSGWFDAANGSSPMAATPGASITVPANPQRNLTNDTLNFLIPVAWCTGSVWYEIEVRVQGFSASGTFAGYSDLATTSTGTFLFELRRTLELRYIRVNWGGSTPTAQTCFDTLRTAVPLLPTPTANISALAGVGVQNPGGTGDSDRDDLLDDFDDRHNCSWWEALWEWLGADCPDDDGAIWVLIPGAFHVGKAYDIPSNTCFTPPANGPYAAHELSHCLNQKHVGVMCANGQQAQGGDAPSAWPNNAQLTDVPFDVTRNVALTLAGTGVFDVMTYCGTPNNTWPMPARWQRLWDRIGS